jgi:GNAT superfamily N-acetyltransferase
MKFVVRQAERADVNGMAAAHLDSIQTIGARYYEPRVVAAWSARISSDLYLRAMANGEVFFVAIGELDGQPAVLGFSSHRVDGPDHGVSVYVRGCAARCRIGSTLVDAAEAHAIQAGAKSLEIDASLAAVDFYKERGFVETGHGEFRIARDQKMACVFMRRDLVPKQ